MPEYIRSLFFILVIATAFFVFARKSACTITSAENFKRRRNLWVLLTLAAFLGHNFWIYVSIAVPLLLYANRRESNPPALYFSILFVLPVASVQIPGMGLINFFFELSHARLLALCILLPAFFSLRRQGNYTPFGRTGPDKALAGYLCLTAVLYLRDPNVTNTLRQVFYLFTDIFLPYFVISRSLKNLQAFRDALLSLVLAVMIVALLASIEFYKHWLLYSAASEALGLESGMTAYLPRDGLLRALVTAGQPIALGYLMVIGLGIYMFIERSIQHKLTRMIGMAILAAGLFAPLSRGPWVGAAALLVVFMATGRFAARRLMTLALTTILLLPLVSILPGGEKVINLLPFIGSTEKENVDYRERLITNSMIVIQRNPFFGSIDYFKTPEMESMRQGQGIIDIVNSYIKVTLDTGLVGLGLFLGFFAMTLHGINRAIRSIPDQDSEEHLLGRALLSTLLAILLIIFSVSSITIIPIMYWTVAGLGVAYAQMIRKKTVLGKPITEAIRANDPTK
jgi:O-Antigen ligase